MTVITQTSEQAIAYTNFETADLYTLEHLLGDRDVISALGRQFDEKDIASTVATTNTLYLQKTTEAMPSASDPLVEKRVMNRANSLAEMDNQSPDSTFFGSEEAELSVQSAELRLEETYPYTPLESDVVIAALELALTKPSYQKLALDALTRVAPADEKQKYQRELEEMKRPKEPLPKPAVSQPNELEGANKVLAVGNITPWTVVKTLKKAVQHIRTPRTPLHT